MKTNSLLFYEKCLCVTFKKLKMTLLLAIRLCFALNIFYMLCFVNCSSSKELMVITVATEETDGFLQFVRSLHVNDLPYKVLGKGKKWEGGDIENLPGGGFKINLLRNELRKYEANKDLIVVFTDSYDVIFTKGKDDILKAFDSFNASIVFGAEDFCWPNSSLAEAYPKVSHGYKYLNSGGFIGYASELYKIVLSPIEDTEDDQLYYTKVFLNEDLRNQHKIKLDTQARIFQNLNGNSADVSLKFTEDNTYLTNTVYVTTPIIIHGNGPSKLLLNALGNYLAKSWTRDQGCLACEEYAFDLNELEESDYPVVLIAIFIEKPMPFLEDMLDKVANLSYPNKKIHIFVHSQTSLHDEFILNWIKKIKNDDYASAKASTSDDKLKEWHARNIAVEQCILKGCDYLFSLDAEVHLDNPYTLKLLISHNRPILGAMIVRPERAWSTFWGAVTTDGFYARSMDYMDIINYVRRGIWNVPYIAGAYLIKRRILEKPETAPNYIHKLLDADMAMAANYRYKGIFMYVSNLEKYGHLIDPDYFTTEHLHNDMWQMVANRKDWEARYIHPKYWEAVNPNFINKMPCPDVYWFPLFTERFCLELVEMMENFGQWSGGNNYDSRLAGGYENVPTVDIHMNQVAYEQEWLWILKTYVKPMAEKEFIGYTSEAKSIMNFVVRYRPTEQSFLRPHHDSSTYTVNIGLNRPGIDYQGGGANFLRYNCSVTATRMGWSLMHPGRLTHYHEGLKTTNGTRYIMVSFIDP